MLRRYIGTAGRIVIEAKGETRRGLLDEVSTGFLGHNAWFTDMKMDAN